MSSGDAGKLCNRWIVEYHCWRKWKAFSKLSFVDGVLNQAAPTHDRPGSNSYWVG